VLLSCVSLCSLSLWCVSLYHGSFYNYIRCHYAECRYPVYQYAECHYACVVIMRVIMLSVVILYFVMLSVLMLCTMMLTVVYVQCHFLNYAEWHETKEVFLHWRQTLSWCIHKIIFFEKDFFKFYRKNDEMTTWLIQETKLGCFPRQPFTAESNFDNKKKAKLFGAPL
jgi:hypothetical protein